MSKNAFILFIIFLIAATGFLGWFFLFKGTTPEGGLDFGEPGKENLFPFGNRVPVASEDTDGPLGGGTETEETPGDLPIQRLRRLSIEPQAGGTFIGSASTTAVRYVEKATGHIYEAQTGSALQGKISNVTIPKVHEALWNGDGSRLLYRYVSGDGLLKTFYAKISTTTRPEQALEGLYLPNNIREIEVEGSKILYVSAADSGSQIVQADIDGSNKTTAYASAFSDWSLSWEKPETAILFTRPSGLVDGQGFILDVKRGTLTKFVNDAAGLVANQSPKGTNVLLSSGVALYSYNSQSKQTTSIALETIADKCAWDSSREGIAYCAVPYIVPSGIYPDDWYKGSVSFSDRVWKIDVATGDTEIVVEPRDQEAQDFDIVDLRVDRFGTYLLFTNKTDSTLWLYDLK